MKIPYISSGTFFISIIITALISGSTVYLWQNKNIKNAIQANKNKENLTQEILQLRQQLANLNNNASKNNNVISPLGATSTNKFLLGYKFNSSTSTDPFFQSVENKDIVYFDKKLYAKIKKEGENITSIFCPNDLDNLNLIYFSTSKSFGKPTSTLNHIYSYNSATSELKIIFENKNKTILKTMGIEDKKIILTSIKNDTELGKCFSLWAGHDETSYFSLDTSVEQKNLIPYNLPKDKIDAGRLEEQNCLSKK